MGLTKDLKAVLTELSEKEGLSRMYIGGFSMGANVSLKLAGEMGESVPSYLKGVFAVSPPLEIARASRAISQGILNRCYEFKFLINLKALIREKAREYPERYSTETLKTVSSLRDFDNAYVAPCFGFDDADDYYERASCGPVVDAICLPTLVIHSEDDTLVPKISVRTWEKRAKKNIQFLITKAGGHTGFISKKAVGNDVDRFWAENRIVQFLESLENNYCAESSGN